MSNISLVDLFSKLSKPIKKAGAVAKEKHELYREEKEVAEEERRRREEEARQNRHSEKERKMVEEQISEEEKRARKFAAIANVTTNARIESGEKIEKDSLEKPEEPDPMEIQRKESREFQKDLNDYLKGKTLAMIFEKNSS